MEKWDIIVIGAGAAGMLAAISACGGLSGYRAKENPKVLLLEKKERAGRKILITGKGRCNITNMKEWSEFSTHIHPSDKLLKPAFFAFSNRDTLEFFESGGLKTVLERGSRLYPASGKSSDVVQVLVSQVEKNGAEIRYNAKVKEIINQGDRVMAVSWTENGKNQHAECGALIIATGGLSYPLTGSEGDGYKFARSLGHNVKEPFPSLTALMPKKYNQQLKGLILKNVAVTLLVSGNEVQSENGEVEFTSAGIEGALGFRVSRKAVRALINGERVSLVLDLKPALTESQIIKRAERECDAGNCKNIRELLGLLLPSALVKPFEEYVGLKPAASPREQDQIKRMAAMLKCLKFDIEGYVSWERAVITAGGVSSDEVIAKNMRSKLYKNLFFAGEVLDLDGDTGGYNLQIAFSTGYLAGREAAYLIKSSAGEPEM